jgi:septum formation protein
MKPTDQKIYLASKSPRRRELLRQIGVEFELLLLRDRAPFGPEVDETVLANEVPLAYVERVTNEKAAFAQKTMIWRKLPTRPILSADTTVVLDNRILGKPATVLEATSMLKALSGRLHVVHTSVCVRFQDVVLQVTQTSEVIFRVLTAPEIGAYCATPEPYDKAGGYAIPGLAGLFIEQIRGSYSGIMGLPLFETSGLLQRVGLKIL